MHPMPDDAELVLTDAAVYTVDVSRPWAEAVAVRGGRIAAVGSAEEIDGLVGSRTKVLRCGGRMVLPGFQDAHVHPPPSGLDRLRCNLEEVVDLEEVKRIVAGIEVQIETLTAYRKSLIHECVTGQRRISEADVRRAVHSLPVERAST